MLFVTKVSGEVRRGKCAKDIETSFNMFFLIILVQTINANMKNQFQELSINNNMCAVLHSDFSRSDRLYKASIKAVLADRSYEVQLDGLQISWTPKLNGPVEVDTRGYCVVYITHQVLYFLG